MFMYGLLRCVSVCISVRPHLIQALAGDTRKQHPSCSSCDHIPHPIESNFKLSTYWFVFCFFLSSVKKMGYPSCSYFFFRPKSCCKTCSAVPNDILQVWITSWTENMRLFVPLSFHKKQTLFLTDSPGSYTCIFSVNVPCSKTLHPSTDCVVRHEYKYAYILTPNLHDFSLVHLDSSVWYSCRTQFAPLLDHSTTGSAPHSTSLMMYGR